jgi:isoleucyl-tRNA synthetase
VAYAVFEKDETGKVISHKPAEAVDFDWEITPELKAEGLSREIIRHIQASRKQAGLNVDDRIVLKLETTSDNLQLAYNKFVQEILNETLGTEVEYGDNEFKYSQVAKIEGGEVTISLKKA